jgi:hypothetical protein
VAGFSGVDIETLSQSVGTAGYRRPAAGPDLAANERALFVDVRTLEPRVRGAHRKWRLIRDARPAESVARVGRAGQNALNRGECGDMPYLSIRRWGGSVEQARELISAATLHGNVPEPPRLAHLIAGGIVDATSRGRARRVEAGFLHATRL